MNKTIKSDVRQLLYTMVNKFEEKQQKKRSAYDEKQQCLLAITNFIDNLDVKETSSIKETVNKLRVLEEEDLIKTQIQYLKEISSITGVSIATLKRIKKEGQVNDGIFSTPGKKRPHKPTVSNLDSFDINKPKKK